MKPSSVQFMSNLYGTALGALPSLDDTAFLQLMNDALTSDVSIQELISTASAHLCMGDTQHNADDLATFLSIAHTPTDGKLPLTDRVLTARPSHRLGRAKSSVKAVSNWYAAMDAMKTMSLPALKAQIARAHASASGVYTLCTQFLLCEVFNRFVLLRRPKDAPGLV